MLRSTLLLMLSLVALPALGQERSSRARVSANGAFTVRLVQKAPGKCTLEVARESGPVWTLKQCVGGVDDLYFVSNDGERVWVLFPLAPKGTVKLSGKQYKKVPAWANTVVAEQYGRGGRLQERRLLSFVSPREVSEVRELGQHLKWLEGVLGVPGKGPRLTDAGRIEFETVGNKSHQLTF
ncbi:hypothetical protein ATI61_107494 [Archangium gephyra]|uniref:Uncharacterized protein n=1 Tax=Archangium gephyra TaxID=48 RepID=A0AAC8TJA2_9BACT|nr:hypothetical protein [Archangium gephyra]AKJ08057.1 Hypothetical protein AA314_09683 [Archangium gephyra]REG29798.1 hypothetical protein ATI61_107494 [Archangium gephyra]